MTTELTIDEFMQIARPEIERQVDERILAEPDAEARMMMTRHRGAIVAKLVDVTEIMNLRAENARLEERLKPRLVES